MFFFFWELTTKQHRSGEVVIIPTGNVINSPYMECTGDSVKMPAEGRLLGKKIRQTTLL